MINFSFSNLILIAKFIQILQKNVYIHVRY
jgi:hypothetical protein